VLVRADLLSMRKNSVIAAGLPRSFREEVARAVEAEPDEIVWVQSMPSVEEYLIRTHAPVDLIVLSSQVHEPDALPMAEFVARTSPHTAIILVRDHTSSGLLPAAMRVGIRDVVDSAHGAGALRDSINRVMGSTGTPNSELGHSAVNGHGHIVEPCVGSGSVTRHESRPKAENAPRPPTTRDQNTRTAKVRGRWRRKIGIGLATVAVILGYLYFYVAAPGELDIRYCQQFLSVMQETHDLTRAPTSEQAQQLKTSVEGLARIDDAGGVSFQGASAAAALIRDSSVAASSPTPENVLAVSRDADALTSACRSDTE
jgi:DNA-binding NarL/FixJ family response regulator